VRAVVEVDRRGNVHAAVGQPARGMEMRQDFVAATLVQLRSNGRTGDLGAAAVRAVAEVDRRGSAHVLVGRAVREIQLRQGAVRVTHVQLRFNGQTGSLGAAAVRAVVEGNPAGEGAAQAA